MKRHEPTYSGRIPGRTFARLIPRRCRICGTWGHSLTGNRWLCDDCLSTAIRPGSRSGQRMFPAA